MDDVAELESLLRRGIITRRQFVRGLLALGVTLSGLDLIMGSTSPAAASEVYTPARYLVLITFDAFRPDYMSLAPMPVLADLMRRGTSYDNAWVGQLESETPVSHATLSTGALPKNDGVIGFEWRDPKTQTEALDGWSPGVLQGKLEADIKASGAHSIPELVKAANPKATVVTASSEKVYAADAMGGVAADYILYHQRVGRKPERLVPAGVPGRAPHPDVLSAAALRPSLPMKHFTDWDYLSAMLALTAFQAYRPEVLMVNFPSGDVYGHPYGGSASPEIFSQVVAGIDRNLGRIVNAYRSAGIFDQTLFVIAGDHGMVPNYRTVAGATTKAVTREAGGQYMFHTGGTAADIYLHNYWHARAVAEAQLKVPGVAAAYYATDPHGQREYVAAPGMDIDPALDAAYQYMLNTYLGPTSPDVFAPFRENTVGTASSTLHGDHGGVNWGAQHVPIILYGPGVPSGQVSHAPARLVDVAPTLLRLLGLQGQGMDGVVLADAVLDATAAESAAQAANSSTLAPIQEALIAESQANIAEDASLHIAPPSPAPARP
jgi:predicted AlkP superfamily pyrophosphatase or phosphodiesterase